jgi:hypothetical protein
MADESGQPEKMGERCVGLRAVHSRDYHRIVAHGTADEARESRHAKAGSIAAESPSGCAEVHHRTG